MRSLGGSSLALRSGLRAALRARPEEPCPRRVPKGGLRWLLRSLPTPPPPPTVLGPGAARTPASASASSDPSKGSVASSIGLNDCAEPMCCYLMRQRSTPHCSAAQHVAAPHSLAGQRPHAFPRPPIALRWRATSCRDAAKRSHLPSSMAEPLPVSPFVACRTAGGHNQWISAVAVRSARRV